MTFRNPNGLPGAGPWLILAACPAPFHNTLHAALGRHVGGQKCVCPRALYHKETRRQNGALKKKKLPKQPLHAFSRFLYMTPAVSIEPMPRELKDAACRDGDGLAYADDGMDRHMTKAGMVKREQAKNWCELACPVKRECLEYVTKNEAPAGSWGGVWGGLDPWQRHGLELYLEEGKVRVREYVKPAVDAA